MSSTNLRRTSYGPSSPVIGSRGARTRQQILDTALLRFTEDGFQGTSMEDIAVAAETSRATLYQYFESKEAIFLELMQSTGAAIMRVTRRLGPLGPTAEGFDNLHWWLGEWSWVFDRYATMFIQWANVSSPKNPLRPLMDQWATAHNVHFSKALRLGGLDEAQAHIWANLVIAVTNRYNYIRHVYRPGLTDTQMLDSLAIALQLAVFPDTPRAVLVAGPHSIDGAETSRPATTPPLRAEPLSTLPETEQILPDDPFDGLSAQASRTVRTLLDAAGRVFAEVGYDFANVDQIVTEAGVARGTFYRYFDDKLQVLTALANECAASMAGPITELASLEEHADPAALRATLRQFLEQHDRYSGVLRAWTEGVPVEASVLAPSRIIINELGAAVRALFGPPRDYPLSRRATGVMLAALLEHYPTEGKGTEYEPTVDDLIETQARFIERVLLTR